MPTHQNGKSPIQRGGSNTLRKAINRVVNSPKAKIDQLVACVQVLAWFEGYDGYFKGPQKKASATGNAGPVAANLTELIQTIEEKAPVEQQQERAA